jgi:hypothetical protein
MKKQQVNQHLIICNAYAFQKALDVYIVGSHTKITTQGPLAYKECDDFKIPLADGEEIEFKAGDIAVGSFFTTKLPRSSASLLLIPHRRHPSSLSATFDSHTFNDLHSAQIAIIDAFRGQEKGRLNIMDTEHSQSEEKRVEELQFNSVVVLKPGKYDITLEGNNTTAKTLPLEVSDQTVNVLMRVGNDDGTGKGASFFSPDLVAFAQHRPVPDPTMLADLRSSTRRAHMTLLTGFAAVLIESLIHF